MAGSQAQVAPVKIRQLFQLEEFEDVLALQKSIWSFEDIELLPLRFLVVVSKVGGHVFGAYAGTQMVGFCFAIPGIKPGIKPGGMPYLHSHMLGVLPEYRNAQVGRRLKLRQREDALERGIALIEWTFDPLELKNAFLNIEKLGAIVRRYNENQYGTTSSPLHGGLPTDRCTAEWWIDSPRVRAILEGAGARARTVQESNPTLAQRGSRNQAAWETAGPAESGFGAGYQPAAGWQPAPQSLVCRGISRAERPSTTGQEACPTRIAYPVDIAQIRTEDPARAREIQRTNARLFGDAFARGLAVTGFARTATEGAYLLEPFLLQTQP